ncbi:MAG TPA: TIGR02281 family clan AA aspartic protease [Burkholderiales bacterium]|nr:TIGR02281 family clan AA aspartic protease [Burkholderiales bacterium]
MRNLSPIAAGFLLTILAPAQAADIVVVGLFPNKAVVSINGGKPRTLSVGETSPEGVKLVAATSEAATFEVGGKRRTLAAGEGAAIAAASARGGGGTATLTADSRGHFITTGVVNGVSLRFMVDTGATSVVLSSADARRVGVNYLGGARSFTQTANGVVPVYSVKLDTVRVGDITLHDVDAVVIEGERLPIALLGMSFLNRTEMKRDGVTMTLTRRY